MNPTNSDYGSGEEQALVPGTLTVFRHFILDGYNRLLYPCNTTLAGRGYPFSTSAASRAYPVDPEGGRHRAECGNQGRPYIVGSGWTWRDDHDAPNKTCRCGFYASYDPATDFYPDMKWGEEFSRNSGQANIQHMILVRAACEVSGRVVMGRLGVRAERMEIKGIAIDWDKQVKFSRPALGYYQAKAPKIRVARLADGEHILYEDFVGDDATYPLLSQEDEGVMRRTDETAERYGIKVYDSIAELHEAHPKADISALGVDTTPEPAVRSARPYRSGGILNLSTSISQMSASIAQAQAQVQSYVDRLKTERVTVSWDDEAIPFAKEEEKLTTFERVMLNKRNRSAPPGSGINYRV